MSSAVLQVSADTVPKQARGDARRAAILRIAGTVFLEEGYAAASMSAIAARLGGSKGTLYNHFRSKEELFAAFLRETCALEAMPAFDFSGFAGDLTAELRRFGGRFLRFMLSDTATAVHRVVIAEGARFPELGQAFYEIGPKPNHQRFTDFLEVQMQAARLRRADPARAGEQFIELCKAGLYQRRLWHVIEPTEAEIDANVDAAVDVFMRAYGPE